MSLILKTRAILATSLLAILSCGSLASQTVTTIYSFGANDGTPSTETLAQGRDGKLYGTAGFGGANTMGTIFQLDTATNSNKVVYNFTGPDGTRPSGGLTRHGDGNFYGTTEGVEQTARAFCSGSHRRRF